MKSVACIITVYKNDHPEYFKEALNSIINQSYKASDIHIYLGIDGNLSMELTKIIKDYESSFYKILKNDINKGLAYTLNNLIENLEDEIYIFRMDSDDICYKDRFEKQINYMNENQDVMVLGGAINEINNKKESLFIRTYPKNTKQAIEYIYKASIFAHPTVCFRKDIFNKGYRYNSTNRFNEDIELWYKFLIDEINVSNIDDIVLYFRKNNNFYKRRGLKKAFKEFEIYFRGNSKLFGVLNWKQIFPILRFFSRLLPTKIAKYLYQSDIRKRLNNKS